MSMTTRIADDQALPAIVLRLLGERADVTPSDLVELLGDDVIWGPPDPHPTSLAGVGAVELEPVSAAA